MESFQRWLEEGVGVLEPDPEPEPPSRGVLLIDLEWSHCRWPIAELGAKAYRYCGEAKDDLGGSYCRAHRLMSIA